MTEAAAEEASAWPDPATTRRTWRYQPVLVRQGEESYLSLCEVYLDAEGRLSAWTGPGMSPQGNDAEDLEGDLANMLAETRRWAAVPRDELKVGMAFEERAVADRAAEDRAASA